MDSEELKNFMDIDFDKNRNDPLYFESVDNELSPLRKSMRKKKELNQPHHDPQDKAKGKSNPKNKDDNWVGDEENRFFVFLGKYMMQYPSEFKNWDYSQKKGIFINMARFIKTKTKRQCRSKFSTFKKKHSEKKNENEYFHNMRELIMFKLNEMKSEGHKEGSEVLVQIKSQSDELDKIYFSVVKELEILKKEQPIVDELERKCKQLFNFRETRSKSFEKKKSEEEEE